MTLSAVVDQVMSAIHGRGWSRDRGPADCGFLPEEDENENVLREFIKLEEELTLNTAQ